MLTIEVILAAAFDREVDLQRSPDDSLTKAAATIFKFGENKSSIPIILQSEFE